jgi:hypothetical protein
MDKLAQKERFSADSGFLRRFVRHDVEIMFLILHFAR